MIVGGGPRRPRRGRRLPRGGRRALAVRILAGEPELPYERPPLTKEFLRGRIEPEETSCSTTPDWYRQHQIEVELRREVAELDLEAGEARAPTGGLCGFERCLLATGARPLVPEIPGADGPTSAPCARSPTPNSCGR